MKGRLTVGLIGVFLCIATIAGSLTAGEVTPSYRYLTVPYRLELFEESKDFQGYKMCGITSWKLENSGYPDKLKNVRHVYMRTLDAIAATGGACDFVLVQWDVKANRDNLQKAISARRLIDIPTLSKK